MGAETYATRASRSVLTGPPRTTTTGAAHGASGATTATAPGRARTGPVAWRIAPSTARSAARAATPEPRLRQLMGVCGWAAVLGGLGLVVGIRSIVGFITAEPPAWYEPSVIATGALGLGFAVGAFLTVHRAKVPWILLTLSTAFLLTAMILTTRAF